MKRTVLQEAVLSLTHLYHHEGRIEEEAHPGFSPKFSKLKPHILLVEDNAMIQTSMMVMLKALGCDVDLAEDGEQALEYFHGQYDLILLDIGLPGIDGLQVARAIRFQEKFQERPHTPIIATTAYDTSEIRQKNVNVGIDEVHSKLTTLYDIKKILDRWLSKKFFLREHLDN